MHLWHYALRTGCELNVLMTVNIAGFDARSDEAKAAARERILNNCGQFARRHGFPIVYVWTREAEVDGSGEHFHILLHVPRKFRTTFSACADRWLPDDEIDVRAADYRTRRAVDGRMHNVLLYIAKQMSPQACYRTPWRRQKGGRVVGQRWGCSRSLSAEKRSMLKAYEHHRTATRAMYGSKANKTNRQSPKTRARAKGADGSAIGSGSDRPGGIGSKRADILEEKRSDLHDVRSP